MNDIKLSRADLHVHSSASFDVPDLRSLRPRALFEKALDNADPARRMDFFTLTDHDTMAGYASLVRDLPEADRALVIPAVEHSLLDPAVGFTIHVNLYGLHPDQYAEIRRRVVTLDDLLAYCRTAGIRAQYNHPTWWERRELRQGLVDFEKVPAIAERFEVLELNAGRTAQQNRITGSIAEDKGKFLTASTDTHTGDVGRAHTLAPGATAADFLAAVWRGETRHCLHSITYDGLVDEAHAFIEAYLGHVERKPAVRHTAKRGQALAEAAGARLVASPFVRNHPAVLDSVRHLLRGVSRPIMRVVMGYERRLEERLAASALSPYAAVPVLVRSDDVARETLRRAG